MVGAVTVGSDHNLTEVLSVFECGKSSVFPGVTNHRILSNTANDVHLTHLLLLTPSRRSFINASA